MATDVGTPPLASTDRTAKRWEYRLKRLLLRLVRGLAPAAPPPDQPLGPGSKVLFIRLNRIGDALISTALIEPVKARLGCTVHVYADVKNRFVFDSQPFVDRVYAYRKRISDFWYFRALCRRERYDAIVDCHDDVSTTVSYLVALSGAPYRIGLYRPANHQLYTHTYPRTDPARTHVLDRLLQLTQAFGFTLGPDEGNVVYHIPAQALAQAEAVWAQAYPARGVRVGVNLSAGSEARFWGEANFACLVADLTALGVQPMLLGLPSDQPRAGRIAPGVPFYYNPDFAAFSAIIPALDLLFTPDTSLVHVASAYHIPAAVLYVHSNPNLQYWYPYRSAYVAVTTPADTLATLPYPTVWQQLAPFLNGFLGRSR
ncbi:MAG: glycosyltransferase family 9 protein [Bacteroidia bacterium]|nr:glycosyltransferase family 9 protein [Bacteroidia bacterium]